MREVAVVEAGNGQHAHGVRGDFVDYRYKQAFEDKPNWTLQVFSTGALPHFEVPDKFIRRYEAFLNSVTQPQNPPANHDES